MDTPVRGRILVVEDEPAIADMCARVLRSEGFHVEVAASGRVAQDMIRKGKYDFCLIDVRTPETSGIEFYQWLETECPPTARGAIFTTGSLLDEKIMAFVNESGRPFLPKPFTPAELRKLIKEVLKQPES